VVEESRFSSAFTFQYSPRPGTPAYELEPLPKAVVQERYERLVELQERISLEENQAQVGRTVEVLVAEGEGRKDGESRRVSGRAADNRLVHLALPARLAGADGDVDARLADEVDPELPRPGDLVEVDVTYGAPHHLVADSALEGGTFRVRRTRAGDAWARQKRARAGLAPEEHSHGSATPAGPVVLGLPTVRADRTDTKGTP